MSNVWDGVFSGVKAESVEVPSPLAVEVGDLFDAHLQAASSVLEAGSGSGALSAHLAQRGYQTTLLDQSSVALELSRQVYGRYGLKGKFMQGDLFQMPFPDKSFDCIWNSGVMEHFSDDTIVKGLAEMARVSRRWVIVLVPNAAGLFYRAGKWALERSGRWAYGDEFPRYSSADLFRRAGIQVIGEGYVGLDLGIDWLNNLGAVSPEVTATLRRWTESLGQEDLPIRRSLGYLLATVGQRA